MASSGHSAPYAMTSTATPTITIRHAYADDELSLRRLAALDSTPEAPAQPLLLAEVDGELRAALSLSDGSSIADPFYPTLDLIELLRVHAVALQPRRRRRRYGRTPVRIGQLRTA
jgi:hypothetical protein